MLIKIIANSTFIGINMKDLKSKQNIKIVVIFLTELRIETENKKLKGPNWVKNWLQHKFI